MASVIAIKSFNYGSAGRIIRGDTFYPTDDEANRLVGEGKVRIITLEAAKKKEEEPVICSGLKQSVLPVAQASQKRTVKKSTSGDTKEIIEKSL